ncbi:MAG: HD domain-containing protein, partial [bacterium]|nr:HD domain-containing protein [bacterium]
TPGVSKERIVLLCLFHDLGEGRTSDLNYVHQRYGRLAEANAIRDIAGSVPFGADIKACFDEWTARQTLEAQLAKDADQLEWLATLREEAVKGNTKGQTWAKKAFERLKTPAGKKIGKLLLTTNPDDWWLDIDDPWFVDRKEKDRAWKKK